MMFAKNFEIIDPDNFSQNMKNYDKNMHIFFYT